ncbi:hypothetical protein TIFTF001_038566 [Ficus carica]|uniref:Glycine-rich protein n=1 Tax=Ficus carica TaxID=3494 RepID=A0AA88JA18_FICCA|nr:hypothetical protein TIFTF001_038566 [Ficus carica]
MTSRVLLFVLVIGALICKNSKGRKFGTEKGSFEKEKSLFRRPGFGGGGGGGFGGGGGLGGAGFRGGAGGGGGGSVAVVALDLVLVMEGMVEELEVGVDSLEEKRSYISASISKGK